MRSIAVLACVMGVSGSAYAVPVTPNFTSGTITANTESKTTVVETIRQTDYSNGYTYVVTGTNVQASNSGIPVPSSIPVAGNGTTSIATPPCSPNSGTLCYGTSYSVINPSGPFQLTETYNGPGIFRETATDRTTTQTSTTMSTSVFTQ